MSFSRILASTVFICAVASQAYAAEPQVEIAQYSEYAQDEIKAINACRGKPVGAACSFSSQVQKKQVNGKCVQPPPVERGYGTMVPQPVMCQ